LFACSMIAANLRILFGSDWRGRRRRMHLERQGEGGAVARRPVRQARPPLPCNDSQ
jgi:hypothetical protein